MLEPQRLVRTELCDATNRFYFNMSVQEMLVNMNGRTVESESSGLTHVFA